MIVDGLNTEAVCTSLMVRRSRRGRTGASRSVVAVAIIIILVAGGLGAYVFLARGSNTSTSTTSTSSGGNTSISSSATTSATSSTPTAQVQTSVNQLMSDFTSRNVDGMVSFYNNNAVDVWSGALGGLQGQYTGAGNIRLLYALTVGKASSIKTNVSSISANTLGTTKINATYTINMIANSSVAGGITATILASEQWILGSGGWQISLENWNYTHYDSTFIDAKIPSATTFPQWGYMLKGGNPNLVSEKSFEWHAGPYVAAAVYAFLFGVVMMTVLRLRSSRGTAAARQQGRAGSTG
jgi:hypothetical protein